MNVAHDAFAGRIRRMTHMDLEAVVSIETRAYAYPWSKTILQDCIRVGYGCWVVESRIWVEGYAIMSTAAQESHLLNLCVRPESQGRGLARRMLEHVLEHSRSEGSRTLFLEVRPSNHRAVELYRSMGFCELGVRPNYYPDAKGHEDALVMARDL